MSCRYFFISLFLHFFLSFCPSFLLSFFPSFFISFFLSFYFVLFHFFSFFHSFHVFYSFRSFHSFLVRWFADSLTHWFIDSMTQSLHWHLNHHLLFRWCTSQLQDFIASASQKLSCWLNMFEIPPRHGQGTTWCGWYIKINLHPDPISNHLEGKQVCILHFGSFCKSDAYHVLK